MQFPVSLTCAKPIPCLAGIGSSSAGCRHMASHFHCWVSRAPEFKVSVLNNSTTKTAYCSASFPKLKRFPPRSLAVRISVRSPEGDTLSADESQTLRIQSPKLWWPAGYGDQPLYTVFCELTDGTQVLDTWTRRIGLRTITLDRKPDAWGESFCHTVNGLPIFAMGADYIPEDSILSRRSPDRTRRLLEDARLAHFNTIRVWGGGLSRRLLLRFMRRAGAAGLAGFHVRLRFLRFNPRF